MPTDKPYPTERIVPRVYETYKTEVECPIVQEVIDKLSNRAAVGMQTYGVTMDRKDLSTAQWIDHAIEEALDLANYLTRLKKDLASLPDQTT